MTEQERMALLRRLPRELQLAEAAAYQRAQQLQRRKAMESAQRALKASLDCFEHLKAIMAPTPGGLEARLRGAQAHVASVNALLAEPLPKLLRHSTPRLGRLPRPPWEGST